MILFHRTDKETSVKILKGGFCDGVGNYLTTNEYKGVWLSNCPLDENEGAYGEILLEVLIDLTADELIKYEWIEQNKWYREFLVPANVVNKHSIVRIMSIEEEDKFDYDTIS